MTLVLVVVVVVVVDVDVVVVLVVLVLVDNVFVLVLLVDEDIVVLVVVVPVDEDIVVVLVVLVLVDVDVVVRSVVVALVDIVDVVDRARAGRRCRRVGHDDNSRRFVELRSTAAATSRASNGGTGGSRCSGIAQLGPVILSVSNHRVTVGVKGTLDVQGVRGRDLDEKRVPLPSWCRRCQRNSSKWPLCKKTSSPWERQAVNIRTCASATVRSREVDTADVCPIMRNVQSADGRQIERRRNTSYRLSSGDNDTLQKSTGGNAPLHGRGD